MVTLRHNLRWVWQGLTQEGTDKFLKTVEQMSLIARRTNHSTDEEKRDSRLNVMAHGSQSDFLIYPAIGSVDYHFGNLRGQGFDEESLSISYNARGSYLINDIAFRISDKEKRFCFLTESPSGNLLR